LNVFNVIIVSGKSLKGSYYSTKILCWRV